MRTHLLALLLLVAPYIAEAQVYKCRRGGVIAYQDKPCPSGTQLGKITLDAPQPGKAPSSSVRPPVPVADTPPAPPPPQALAPARNYKCTRFDGAIYYSGSAMPNRHHVPVYALKNPPAAGATGNVWVTDSCVEAPIEEACTYYDQQIDFVLKQARTAQATERKKLEREGVRLRTISNSRCKRR